MGDLPAGRLLVLEGDFSLILGFEWKKEGSGSGFVIFGSALTMMTYPEVPPENKFHSKSEVFGRKLEPLCILPSSIDD